MMEAINRWKMLFAIVVSALALTACGDGGETENACDLSSDCPEGERCGSSGVCTTQSQSCEFSSECAPDEFCQTTDGVCQIAACEDDAACGEGAICDESVCRRGCREDADCESGFSCTSTNICEPEGCTTGSCGDFQTCNESLDPPACEFTGRCDCGDPPEGVSDQEWCEGVPGGNPVCAFYTQQEGIVFDYICSNAANECVERPECQDDSECPDSQICEPDGPMGKRICRGGCRDDDGCPPFSICVQSEGNVCRPGCSNDSECGQNQTCIDFVCIDTCETRQDCDVVGQVCQGAPRTCKGCTNDNQCAVVEFCDYSLGSNEEETEDPLIGLCAPIVTCPDDGYGTNVDADSAYGVQAPFDGTGENAPAFCSENAGGEWFEINANTGDVIDITLNYDEREGNLDLALLQSNGQQLIASARPPQTDGGTEMLRYGVPVSQPLLVQVRGSIVQDFIDYDLTIDVAQQGACTDDGYEPNQDEANAASLPATNMDGTEGDYPGLQVCGGDRDFYEVCADNNQVVLFEVDADPRFGNIDFTVRGEDGSILENAQTQERLEVAEVLTTDPECLTVEVFPATGVGVIDYDFRWAQRPNVCTDQFEQNDTCPQQVTDLAVGTYDDIAICSDPDYYCFDTLPLQTIDFKACYDSNVAGDLDVTLFGPDDCAAFLQTEVSAPGDTPDEVCETLNYQVQQAGRYCVQGSLFSGLNVPYRIDFDLIDGPACQNDSFANNTPQDAVVFDRTLASTGDDNVASGGRICDLEDDWFEITLQDGDVIEFETRFTNANGNIDTYLYGPNDSTALVDSSESTTADSETVTHTVSGPAEAGTYYLRVTANPAARTDYTVITYLNGTGPADPDCPDPLENNDDRANASAIAPGSYGLTVCGVNRDDDWFTTTLAAGETITIDLTYSPSEGNVDLDFYSDRATGSPTQVSALNTGTEQIVYTTARDQQVAWRARTNLSSDITPYTISYSISGPTACSDDAFEDNDVATNATPVSVPGLYGALNKCEDDEDWYEIVVPANSSAEVFANFEYDEANLDITVYESDGTTVVESGTSTTDDESVIISSRPSETTYLVQIDTVERGRVRYDLLLYLDGNGPEDRVCPDQFEQNDSFNDASPIPNGFTEDLLLCWQGGGLNDRDWYSLTVPGGATVTVDLLFSHSEGDIDATLYRETPSSPVSTGLTTDDDEQLTATNPNASPTTYLVQVYGKGQSRFTSNYDIEITLGYSGDCSMIDDSVTSASRADADTAGTTVVGNYPDLTLCESSEDWVKLPSGITSIEAHIEYSSTFGNIDLELIEWDGTTEAVVASSNLTSNVETIDETTLDTASDYYLRIFATGFTRTNYDLWFATNAETPAVDYCPDPYERNDSPVLSASLPSQSVQQFQDALACGLDDDYYSLTPTRSVQNYFAVFSNAPDDQDISLEVIDPNDNQIASEDSRTDGDEILTYTPSALGQHKLGVSNSGNSGTQYDFLYGTTAMYTLNGCPEDGYEDNDNVAAASQRVLTLPVREALGVCGDDDYFSFTAPTTDPVEIEVRFDQTENPISLQVTGGNVGFQLISPTDNRARYTINPTTAGTTYQIGLLRGLNSSGGTANGPYFLHITQ